MPTWTDDEREPEVLSDADCERLLQPGQQVEGPLGEALRAVAAVGDGPVPGESAVLAAFRAHHAGATVLRSGRHRASKPRLGGRLSARAGALLLGGAVVVGGGAAAAATGHAGFLRPVLVHLDLIAPSHPTTGPSAGGPGGSPTGTGPVSPTPAAGTGSGSVSAPTTPPRNARGLGTTGGTPPPGLSSANPGQHRGTSTPGRGAGVSTTPPGVRHHYAKGYGNGVTHGRKARTRGQHHTPSPSSTPKVSRSPRPTPSRTAKPSVTPPASARP